MYDIIIIGAGPAGLASAAYCLRKRLDVLVIAPDLGGKANYRMHLAGLEGFEHITGEEIVRKFRSQLQYLEFAHVHDLVAKVDAIEGAEGDCAGCETFSVTTEGGSTFAAKALIVAAGVDPMRLQVPNEMEMVGRGVSYSAVSHAPLFWEREAVVVGSGGLALRSAAELATVASRVILVAPEGLPDDPLRRKLARQENVTILEKHIVTGIKGDGYVHGVTVRDAAGKEQEIPVTGVFGELGFEPRSGIVKDLVDLNAEGFIKIDDRCRTSRPGIFAAGDVTDTYTEQVLIAIGEGAKAALAVYDYLLRRDV